MTQELDAVSPMERLGALLTYLRELHQQELEWVRHRYACLDEMEALTPAICAVLEEVVWLEHPTWHRDRPTPQARVQRIARDRWYDVKEAMWRETTDAAVNPQVVDSA